MATSTGEVEKINVRSPYYLTVDSATTPPEYNPPATITQPLGCGEQINIGEDVGTRIYEVDVTNRSGTFTINYTINIPIKITHQLTEDSSPTVVGYKGNNEYEGELLKAGVPASELTGLSTGEAQGGIAITRSTDTASTLTITVEAPLATDDYQLIMSCPDETQVETPSVGTPANNTLDTGTYTLLMRLPFSYIDTVSSSFTMEIYINGELIETLPQAVLNVSASTTKLIVFSTQTGYNYTGGGSVITVSNEELLADQYNSIGIKFITGGTNDQVTLNKIGYEITGLFQNPNSGQLEWADPRAYSDYNFYGYGSQGNVPNIPVPRITAESYYQQIFRDQTQKVIYFNPSAYEENILQVEQGRHGTSVIGGETVENIFTQSYAAWSL
ncbi:MAG: hypothetical protein Unbinned5089contig1000_17 [Prokaryotic dsDNA virus sp.]|nr:MAG: hypothetical protein Unbinned5089contig1000_17 [Prokaryotic dsDNA virus sp.]|tara:strand:+ start:2380 stop:3537 length:1158 start_codon:yes stop_codon:yes gene_type:complete